MPTQIERIRDLKTGAKNQRDRGTKGYPRALSMLRDAIAIARADLDESSVAELRTQLATELSDCFGLVGGVERRWADESAGEERALHLKASIRAYDDGFKFESDPQYGIVNSYNLVNRLLIRLLLSPGALVADDAVVLDPNIPPVKLAHELEQAWVTIRQQLAGPRRGDYWALADLALLEVLLGRSSGAVAYADFIGLSPPHFAYASALASLRPLAELPVPSAPSLREAVALLESRLQRLRS
jgi:hypothetical protein